MMLCETDDMSPVTLSIESGVAVLTLNRPDERNTLTADMVSAIVAAMDKVEADRTVGAVVVTGAPPAFCAGANLGNLAEATADSLGAIYEGFLRVARSPLPTIAAVNGAAVGAGTASGLLSGLAAGTAAGVDDCCACANAASE